MPQVPPRDQLLTHEVLNQPDGAGGLDLWGADPVLRAHALAAGADADHLSGYGATFGSVEMRNAGRDANRQKPELCLFDAGGRRLDEVHFHPAYHALLKAGIGGGYASVAWEGAGKGVAGGHATHAAMVYMTTQVEPGVCCPMTMTYAAVPTLQADDELFARWVPKLVSRVYDASIKPVEQKAGATLGMAMTEKQGGSDVRANTTRAAKDGTGYRLRGHKWFCSAPMSDGFLTLAQAPGGLTCFLVPRWLEGERNAIHIQRLKDKLGNRANASAEIEYADAFAWRLGEEGNGIRTILEMVHHTRLDTAMAPAGLMRAALCHAVHWVQHRSVFQKTLIDQPLMRTVLADLILDWEGATALGLFVARLFDSRSESDAAFARLAVALAKYLNNKLCPGFVYEAMEALGGMGYVEDTDLPLLYREAPLNSIWEGSGNVICLDILRSLRKVPLAGEALGDALSSVSGQFRQFDTALNGHMTRFPSLPQEAEARWYVESLATLLTAAILVRQAPVEVSTAYITTRLSSARGRTVGAISGVDVDAILARVGTLSEL